MRGNLFALFSFSSTRSRAESEMGQQVDERDSLTGTSRTKVNAVEWPSEKASNLGWGEMDDAHARRCRRRSRQARSRRAGSGKPPAKFW